MVDLIFGADTIVGVAQNSPPTFTVAPGSVLYSFNPFAGATITDGGATGGNVTLVLSLTNITGGTNGETVIVGGNTQYITTGNTLVGSPATFVGNHTDAAAWLNSVQVLEYSLNDRFRLTLTATDNEGNGTSFLWNYRITCYLRGTMIATPQGERAVESLQIGDLVTTLDGSAKAVKWIGHRTYEAEFGGAERFVRPVLFRAGSLGGGLPTRDLKVSPQHAMLIDGVMVPAATLVNGVSIVRDETVGDTEYFHVELEGHEAIFAEGAAAETYIDIDSRAMFDNADEFGLLYGSSQPADSAFERIEEGVRLAAIRARLAKLAGVELAASAGALSGRLESLTDGVLTGWVAGATGDAVEAEVLVDGEVVASVVANRYRADLDQAGIQGGRCAFTVTLPASAERLEQVSLRRKGDGSVLGRTVVDVVVA